MKIKINYLKNNPHNDNREVFNKKQIETTQNLLREAVRKENTDNHNPMLSKITLNFKK